MREALRRLFRSFDADRQVLVVCLAFSFIVRLGSLRAINNPDAVYKWAAARALLHGSPLAAGEFSHHSARWGVNLPTLAVQFVFGDDAWVYYVPMLVLTTLLAGLTFQVGKELGGKWTGAFAVLLYTPLPALGYLGSQLMPELFQSCYVMGALLALLRWHERDGRSLPWASFAWFCAAYFAKESAVFFLPGLLLGVWFKRRQLRDPAFYAAGFAAIVALETLAYRLTYGFPWGRATIIAKHHLGNAKMKPPIESIGELLVRYLDLQVGFRQLFYAALAMSLAWPLLRQKRWSRDWCLLAVCGSFFLASTFALKSFDPPRLVQPMNQRYLHAGIPFLALIVALFLHRALPQLWNALNARVPMRVPRLAAMQRRSIAGLAVVCAVASLGLWLKRSPPDRLHAISTTVRHQRLLQRAYAEGIPLVSHDKKRYATGAAIDLFLTFEQAAQARVAYLQTGKSKGSKVRVVVDGGHPRYAGNSKKALAQTLRNWSAERHVQFWMRRGFGAKGVRESGARNEIATDR